MGYSDYAYENRKNRKTFRQRRKGDHSVRFDGATSTSTNVADVEGGTGSAGGANNVDIHKRTFSKLDISKALFLLQMHRRRRNFAWEFGVYVAFLFLLLLIMFIGWDIEIKYHMGTAMKDRLVRKKFSFGPAEMDYNDITNDDQFWAWAEGPLVEALFKETIYNGQNVEAPYYVSGFNRRFGSVRFRQLRSKKETCHIWSKVERPAEWLEDCHLVYSQSNEDKESFGENGVTFSYSSPSETRTFRWRSVSELVLYGAGGFVIDFPMTKADFVAKLAEAKRGRYIDRGTRALFVNINLYNPSKRRYHSIQLILEMVTEGGIIVLDQKFRSFRIDLYENSLDYFRLGCEVIFIIYVLYYVFIFVREIYSIWSRRQVFVYGSRITFWHVVDFFALGLFLSGIGLRVFYLTYGLRREFVDGGKLGTDRYEVLEELASLDYTFDSIMAATVALSFFKSFKFLQVNDKMALIWRVLVRAMPNMLGFLIFFAIVFIAFVVMGYIVFGPEMRAFRSFGISFSTLGRMVFGEFDYEPMSFTHPYVAPVYFYSFMILVYFILLNMFLAILNDTYQALMEDFERQQARKKKLGHEHISMFTKIKMFFRRMFDKMRGRTTLSTIGVVDNALKHTDFTEEEAVQRLRKSVTLRTKDRVTVGELQNALGDDAPPDLAVNLMQSYIDSGADVDEHGDDEMNELLGLDEGDVNSEFDPHTANIDTVLSQMSSLLDNIHHSRRRRHAQGFTDDDTTTMMNFSRNRRFSHMSDYSSSNDDLNMLPNVRATGSNRNFYHQRGRYNHMRHRRPGRSNDGSTDHGSHHGSHHGHRSHRRGSYSHNRHRGHGGSNDTNNNNHGGIGNKNNSHNTSNDNNGSSNNSHGNNSDHHRSSDGSDRGRARYGRHSNSDISRDSGKFLSSASESAVSMSPRGSPPPIVPQPAAVLQQDTTDTDDYGGSQSRGAPDMGFPFLVPAAANQR